mgnify:CR=1 FL=1
MTFEEKLRKCPANEIWQEYCGFLDLTLPEYMNIQKRLLMEQIELMSHCELGKRFFRQGVPTSVEEFRAKVPLTKFEDYADVLLPQKEEMLPEKPVLWLHTTWEGGDFPSKRAPYTESMLETYKTNILGAMLLATSRGRNHFCVRPGMRVLYSLAPLPYATGMFPDLISSEINLRFMPSVREARKMSFGQQMRDGYKLAIKHDMNLFFGMSSVLYGATKSLDTLVQKSGGKVQLKDLLSMNPKMLWRLMAARYREKRDGVSVKPKDLFRLQGFVCVGTDTALYKNELEEAWGIRPLEIAGGTEPSCMGTETWSKDGLVLFPDACFYEFIPEMELYKEMSEPGYTPKTYLMDELVAGQKYELVITVLKGGAFLRYRVGDVYRCLRLRNASDKIELPQFEYVDRIPTVIDIAGFTRITQREIERVIALSRLPIETWFAIKEYDETGRSFLNLYVELDPEDTQSAALSRQLLRDHLALYFRSYDGDYSDLKRLLNVDPLKVTILKSGVVAQYEKENGCRIPRVGTSKESVLEILRIQKESVLEGGVFCVTE